MTSHPLSPADDKLVLRILALAHEIQTTTPLCVFCNYSGHVSQIYISIAESKSYWTRKVYDRSCYFECSWRPPAEVSAELKAFCRDLEAILRTKGECLKQK